MYKEKETIELKQQVSKSFLKTVSAYANYNDGEIIFGINDLGHIVGVENAYKEKLKIEDLINNSVDPVPKFNLHTKIIEGNCLVFLKVFKGDFPPYIYNSKTYKRSDTSTIEVDNVELKRLLLEGLNLNYEDLKASKENLTFNTLNKYLETKLNVSVVNLDILKTLNLFNVNKHHYNVAAELLADSNDIYFSGIDIVRFKDDDTFLDRETFKGESVLIQFEKAIEMFKKYYTYERISLPRRLTVELIPLNAFKEALANAIIHRVWDVNSFIQIAMYQNKIVITSPGGLPNGISKEEYLSSNISILRNPTLANVFYRLNLIEKLGTGIMRIKNSYKDYIFKPLFNLSSNFLKIELPVVDVKEHDLNTDEIKIAELLLIEESLSRSQIDNSLKFNKYKTIRHLNKLLDENIIVKESDGIATRYKIK